MASQMQVILARDVPNLGRVGELHTVKAGYARNYLLPQGMAMMASLKKVNEFEHKKQLIAHRMKLLRSGSERKAAELEKIQVTCTVKVGHNDKLFGSVTAREIASQLAGLGYVIDHRDLKIDGPLKSLGLHEIALRLEADVNTTIKVVVVGEKIDAEVEEEEINEDEKLAAESADGNIDVDAEEAALDAPESSEVETSVEA